MPDKAHSSSISKAESWKIFDQIAAKYDNLNRILSFGRDISWRKKLLHFFPNRKNLTIIDLATGTADVLLMCVKSKLSIEAAYGVDMAEKMLDIGRQKISRQGLHDRIQLRHGDVNDVPYTENTFDVATIAFGIRNLNDTLKGLEEMFRIIKKDGRALILEFSLPNNPVVKYVHLVYLRHIVPFIGGAISGNTKAYRYLNETIENFPYGTELCSLMEEAGFIKVEAYPLLFGVATIYKGEKG